MTTPIRVLIVDDRRRSRDGLGAVLDTCPTMEVICEAPDGQEAVRLVEAYQPDVVLMDVKMPALDGIEATRHIKRNWPTVKVIILTMYPEYRTDALAAGADYFLLKGCMTTDLLGAIDIQCEQGIEHC